jgi:hypothetical protein
MYLDIFYELFDEQEYKKFIKSVESQFRKSPEYLLWLNRHTHRNSCSATGLSYDVDAADIEVHHYKITLWEWVAIIVDKMKENGIPVNSHFVCMVLTDIHLNNCIPYISLMHSYHQMITNRSEEEVLNQFPQIKDGINEGDIGKAYEIINYHINIVKEQIEKEEAENNKDEQ